MNKKPQTINGLMKHMRKDCNIYINGSVQKKLLNNYGYFHGYKGYRFFQKPSNRIPFTEYCELISVNEFDNHLKASLYPALMFVETALKNIVCNETLEGMHSATFDDIFHCRMNDNVANAKVQSVRLKLRNDVYNRISQKYSHEKDSDNQMIKHFYDRGEDLPLWVIFEILYFSDLARFFECLNYSSREKILTSIDMLDPTSDTNRQLLSTIIYTLKELRNCVAHNAIIFDGRFKERNIARVLRRWVEKETQIQNFTLNSIFDYIILLCSILKKIDINTNRASTLLDQYEQEKEVLRLLVSSQIYKMLFPPGESEKIAALRKYIESK